MIKSLLSLQNYWTILVKDYYCLRGHWDKGQGHIGCEGKYTRRILQESFDAES